MDRGADQRYFPEPAKSLFIADNLEEEESEKREFERAGLNINYLDVSCYLGAFWGTERSYRSGCSPRWRHGSMGSAA